MMGGLRILVSSLLLLAVLEIWSLYERVSCRVQIEGVQGFYSGSRDGYYRQLDESAQSFPDIFQLYAMRGVSGEHDIVFTIDGWSVVNQDLKVMYVSKDISINHPPSTGWSSASAENTGGIHSVQCWGSLQDSTVTSYSQSNIDIMLNQPVTMIIIIALLYIYYYLNTNNVDVALVSFSYNAVFNQKEYWRVVTSALSHYDLLHIGFNTMALYQLGVLEGVYGSMSYAYLSANLIFLTAVIMLVSDHIIINYFQRGDQMYSSGIGYSCVLFAWIVTASVRMKTFCPIVFVPSACFDTLSIHVPGTSIDLPINYGPIVLLVITKIFIPRSSFLGHLSGIIIGFPLAWNFLGWMTPPVLMAILVATVFLLDYPKLCIWQLPGFEHSTTVNISEIAPQDQAINYSHLCNMVNILTVLSVCIVYFLDPVQQTLPRLLFIFLIQSAKYAKKCMWLTDLVDSHGSCCKLLFLALAVTVFMLCYDFLSLVGGLISTTYLLTSISKSELACSAVVLTVTVVCEFIFLVLLLDSIHTLSPNGATNPYFHALASIKLDKNSVEIDLVAINLLRYCRRETGSEIAIEMTTGSSYHAVRTEDSTEECSVPNKIEQSDVKTLNI